MHLIIGDVSVWAQCERMVGTGGKADIADRLAEGFLSFALLGW